MSFETLSDDDRAVLSTAREFVPAVLEVCFPTVTLGGTESDLAVLQQVLEGGPYTDDPEGELVALGTAFGDLFCSAMGLQWVRYVDKDGADLGLRFGDTSIVIFPRDMVIKRMEKGDSIDLRELFHGVCDSIRQLAESGEAR